MPNVPFDGKYWRSRAEEALAAARQLDDRDAKLVLLNMAGTYDQLAKRVEERRGQQLVRRAPLKAQCTPGKERRISRWEHEAVLETVQDRLDRNPDKMRVRRQTVEHPFGTIKAWMGATHFQMRKLAKVASEMALHVLAYNMKRVIQILGVDGLMAALRA
jgi:hypothetical protein